MTLKMFSVYDSKAEAFIQPFFSQSTGTAVRSFEDAANQESHEFQKHAADYTLFELGDFDQNTGITTCLEVRINLGNALMAYTRPQTAETHGQVESVPPILDRTAVQRAADTDVLRAYSGVTPTKDDSALREAKATLKRINK